ncbi:MAG: response regulator [Anaerolineae bacterium]|nr:response regulator [Anaerolineae bacterium]
MVKRILIVDDEKSVAFFTRENLVELGPEYDVHAALSGAEALNKMSSQPFDLVISDFRMPQMNGLELLYRVQRRWPQTRLILMTAYGNEQIKGAAERLRAYRYITKPFRMEVLFDAIQTAFTDPTFLPSGMIIFSEETFEAITEQLDRLLAATGAQTVLLCGSTGQNLARLGDIPELNLANLTALVAGGLSTTLEMRRILGEQQALNLSYHEGNRFHVYSATVSETLFLLFIFDSRSQASRLGSVWLYAKRAIEKLQELATDQTSTSGLFASDMLVDGFGATLLEEMDGLFQNDTPSESLQEATAQLATQVNAGQQVSSDLAAPETASYSGSASRGLLTFEEAMAQGLVSSDTL